MRKYFTGLLCFVFAGCSSVKVLKTDTAPGIDFSKYHTFGFYKISASGDTVSAYFKENTELLEAAISSEMEKRGYAKVSTNPDLLFNIGIVVQEKVQTRETDIRTDAPRYMGQRNYSWKSEEIEVARYREGTVTVDVVEAAQNKMIWTSAAESVIPDKQSKIPAEISAGTKKIFDKFPSRVK